VTAAPTPGPSGRAACATWQTWPLLGALQLGAALLGACTLAPKLEAPRLSIVSVQLQSSELWAQHLRVRLHVHNPNDRELPVRGLEYTIEIAGEQFASGQSAASFVVPPLGEAEFDTNVTTNLAGALLKLLGRGPSALAQEVPYRISGKVSLGQGLWRSIPFDEHGTFRLQ
jgi:LEA14-like dessication related protein